MKYLIVFLLALFCLQSPVQAFWQQDLSVGEEGSIKGQRRDIYSLALSPDGQYLASGSFDGTTRLWDLKTWQVKYDLPGHSHSIGAIGFSPDGKYLASAGFDGQIQIWDLSTGRNQVTLKDTKQMLISLAFSPDGKYLASGSQDQLIRVYDTQTWRLTRTLQGHTGGVCALRFDPQSHWLASAGFDESGIRLWSFAGLSQDSQVLLDHTDEVYALAFSPDGKYLASAGADKMIRLWDAHTLLPLKRLSGHLKPIWSLAFSPDSQTLVSGSIGEPALRFWRIPGGTNYQTLVKPIEKTYSLVFSNSGQTLYSGHSDAAIRVWQDQRTTHSAQALQFALKLDGWQNPAGQVLPISRPLVDFKGLKLKLRVNNDSLRHLQAVIAQIQILTPAVQLDLATPDFYLNSFEAGVSKELVLPLSIDPGLALDAIDLRVVFKTEGEQMILPLRVPLTRK